MREIQEMQREANAIVANSTTDTSDPNFVDHSIIGEEFSNIYGTIQRQIIECNSESLRYYTEMNEIEELYEMEFVNQINLMKKNAETENEVGTLKDLVDNSKSQYHQFQEAVDLLKDQHQGATEAEIEKIRKLELELQQKEEEMHEMSAEVQTNQDVLKHKLVNQGLTPDKNQDKKMIQLMKSLVMASQDRWDAQDSLIEQGQKP